MIGRLRLIDAVAIAAVALLALKTLGFFSGRPSQPGPQAQVDSSVIQPVDQLPKFARVLAHARSNYIPPDVVTTGAVGGGEGAEAKTSGSEAPPKPAAMEPPQSASASERALLERLGERRDELQKRVREMELRERLLDDAERKIQGRVNELKTLEEKAEAAATKRGDTEAGALRNLVTMYEAMKPKDAARVFDRLSHDVLVPVVLGMKPAKMAEILAVMSPQAAEKLTVSLANRAKGLSANMAPAGQALPPNELPAIEPASANR
jgi:flagellar motility protein MotE (MotC chaperone)